MSSSRSSSYIGLLFATFLALVWVMWSGLSVMLPESDEPSCECNSQFHLISHRGGAASRPENTMAAFRQARELHTDVSMDVAMTADHQLVLMHDDYVDRTTNGHGLLCEMTLDEVKTLDAGSWFGVDYSNERIPMLIEVFAEFGNSTNYHIDLRWPKACPDTPRELAVDKTVWAIQAFGLHRKVAFTVEDPVILQRLKSKLPDSLILASINVLYTLAPLSSMWAFVDKTGADGVSAHFLMPMLKNVLVEANKRKKKVFIYTVDSLYVSRWLECLGVDAIVTNIPEKIVDNAKCPIYRGKFNDDKYHTRVRSLHGATATNATASDGGRRSIDDATEGEWVPL